MCEWLTEQAVLVPAPAIKLPTRDEIIMLSLTTNIPLNVPTVLENVTDDGKVEMHIILKIFIQFFISILAHVFYL